MSRTKYAKINHIQYRLRCIYKWCGGIQIDDVVEFESLDNFTWQIEINAMNRILILISIAEPRRRSPIFFE